jgi:hypothetical protein
MSGPSFISLCAMLNDLCRANDIEPPELTLSFRDQRDLEKFRRALEAEADLVAPFGQQRINSCHGIKFWLGHRRGGA